MIPVFNISDDANLEKVFGLVWFGSMKHLKKVALNIQRSFKIVFM